AHLALPYSVLLWVGFTVPPVLPRARCALTAPFHPCLPLPAGGLFSVALSVGSRPPGVTWHPAHGARTFLQVLPQRLPGRLPALVYSVRCASSGTARCAIGRLLRP